MTPLTDSEIAEMEKCAACGQPADPRFFWRRKPMCDGCCPGPEDDSYYEGFIDGKIAARSEALSATSPLATEAELHLRTTRMVELPDGTIAIVKKGQ